MAFHNTIPMWQRAFDSILPNWPRRLDYCRAQGCTESGAWGRHVVGCPNLVGLPLAEAAGRSAVRQLGKVNW